MKFSCRKLCQSFKYALVGIKQILKQQNFCLMILLAILTLILAWLLKISYLEWLIIILLIGLVLSLEIFNTTVEELLDFINPDSSPKVKMIKDLSAGAVLIACLSALAIGLLIFLPKLL